MEGRMISEESHVPYSSANKSSCYTVPGTCSIHKLLTVLICGLKTQRAGMDGAAQHVVLVWKPITDFVCAFVMQDVSDKMGVLVKRRGSCL